MKITKSQLKQIIKEELYILNEEDSPMEILGVHNISDSRILIDAVRGLLDQGAINDDNSSTIENWLSRRIRKEPDEELQAELTSLRDEMMRAAGNVGRSGQTSYERTRSRGQRYRDEAGGEAPPTGRMTTLQSLGIGENKMKLTKSQLKQIIKEELNALMREQPDSSDAAGIAQSLVDSGEEITAWEDIINRELAAAGPLDDDISNIRDEVWTILRDEYGIHDPTDPLAETPGKEPESAAWKRRKAEAARQKIVRFLVKRGVYKEHPHLPSRIDVTSGHANVAERELRAAVEAGTLRVTPEDVNSFMMKLQREIR
jgi:hypothetical protein